MWKNEQITTLDECLTEVGEELDEIVDVASEKDKEEIMQLRSLINALVNTIPEVAFDCKEDGCGRKFHAQADLDEHYSRRH